MTFLNVGLIKIFDYQSIIDTVEKVDDGVRDNMLDARDVEAQGDGTPRQRYSDVVASKQNMKFILTVRCKYTSIVADRGKLRDFVIKKSRKKW